VKQSGYPLEQNHSHQHSADNARKRTQLVEAHLSPYARLLFDLSVLEAQKWGQLHTILNRISGEERSNLFNGVNATLDPAAAPRAFNRSKKHPEFYKCRQDLLAIAAKKHEVCIHIRTDLEATGVTREDCNLLLEKYSADPTNNEAIKTVAGGNNYQQKLNQKVMGKIIQAGGAANDLRSSKVLQAIFNDIGRGDRELRQHDPLDRLRVQRCGQLAEFANIPADKIAEKATEVPRLLKETRLAGISLTKPEPLFRESAKTVYASQEESTQQYVRQYTQEHAAAMGGAQPVNLTRYQEKGASWLHLDKVSPEDREALYQPNNGRGIAGQLRDVVEMFPDGVKERVIACLHEAARKGRNHSMFKRGNGTAVADFDFEFVRGTNKDGEDTYLLMVREKGEEGKQPRAVVLPVKELKSIPMPAGVEISFCNVRRVYGYAHSSKIS